MKIPVRGMRFGANSEKGLVTKMSSVLKDNNFQARSSKLVKSTRSVLNVLRSQGYECTKKPTIKEIG